MTFPNNQTVTQPDPWDIADNPPVNHGEYWGQVEIALWYCVLQKGVGKVPFDPQQHSADQRRTSVEIKIFPIPEQNVSFDIKRDLIAESREWAGTVLKSIKALGLSAKEINGRYVRVKLASTGQTYTNGNGEERERTTFEFVKAFASEDECKADFLSGGAAPANTQPPAAPHNSAQGTNGNGHSNGNGNQEKQTALNFLRIYVQNAARGQTDLNVIRNSLAANISTQPLLAKYFTVDSPETMQLLAEEMTK